jgi:hypothetical protein
MNARRYLLFFCLIVASDWTLIKGLYQPKYLTEQAKAFVEQRWSTNVGPLFNFARYNFSNNIDCCNGPTTNCCDFPHAQGYLAGLHFDISHSRPSHWYFNAQLDAEWNAGYVNNTANTFLKVKDYRPETDFGYTFFIRENHYFITPFTGLGFYYLSTEFKNQLMTNAYKNVYIPIGFNATWNVHPDCHENIIECFTAGIAATYRIDAWTRLKVTTDGGSDCPNGLCPDLCFEGCETSCNTTCNPCEDKIKLNSRTQGAHVELVFTWFPTFNDKVNFIAVGGPFFDWNRFGGACESSCNSGAAVVVPQLNRWYLGFTACMGLRF